MQQYNIGLVYGSSQCRSKQCVLDTELQDKYWRVSRDGVFSSEKVTTIKASTHPLELFEWLC